MRPPGRHLGRADLAAGLALAAVALVFWWPSLGGGRVPAAGVYQQEMPPFGVPAAPAPRAWEALLWDSVAQFYPWRDLLHRGLQGGELPLWNPHQYCGYPFVGNGQSALFYPPNWLLGLLPTDRFLGVSLALHWLIAGLAAFLLARALGLGVLPALLAGLVYQSSGFMLTWALLPTAVNVMAWLPAAWLGVELLLRGRRGGLPLLAGALGLALLAGHLQFAAYVWLTAALYALVRVAYRLVRRGRAPVAALAVAALLGLGLGLPQVLPSLELGRYSPRGTRAFTTEEWRFQQARALQPVELLTFVWPEALGDPVTGTYPGLSFTEHCGFAGVTALGLALLGLAWRRGRWAAFLGVGALLALGVALAGPPARLLYALAPQLGVAGGFSRILGVYLLCLALLAALGLQALLDWAGRLSARGSGPRWPRYALGVLAPMLVLAELLPWGWRYVPQSPREQVYPQVALTQALAGLASPDYRVLAVTPREAWSLQRTPAALLPPNADTVYGWNSPQGYDSLALAGYRDYARRAEGADLSPRENGNLMLLQNPASPLLREAAVAWVASEAPLSAPGLSLSGEWQGVKVYRNASALPRARRADGTPAAVVGGGGNTLAVETAAGAGPLVVADAYYPGWQAYVDGRPAALSPAGVFRQVDVPEGRHRVWLAYYPGSVVVGLFLGLLSLATLAGLWAQGWGNDRTR